MKFAVKALSGGGSRTGLLLIGSCLTTPLETPAILLSTRKGLPFFLTPDLLSSLPSPHSRLLHVCPLHFFEGLSLQTITKLGGLHKLLDFPEYEYVSVLRDSIDCIPDPGGVNKFGASFSTPIGRFTVKPVEYIDMISSMKPNIWASLADEVPANVSAKRNKISVDRTIRWLDECIALSSGNGAVFGSIVGGGSIEERKRCAEEVASRNVSGYWIGGFGIGESIEDRSTLLSVVTNCLPEEKPRLVSGLGTPEEILQGIAAGVDLFNNAYIYNLTMQGFALTFPVGNSETGNDWEKISLRSTKYRKDTTPIVRNCSCSTCRNHTKAYIHHLLNVKEMLAQILLEIHNTHHYLVFFEAIREAIRHDQFEQFRREFLQNINRESFSDSQ